MTMVDGYCGICKSWRNVRIIRRSPQRIQSGVCKNCEVAYKSQQILKEKR